MRTRRWITAFCVALTASISSADEPQTAVVEPGRRYGMGWLGRFSLGSQWRDLWTTPIEVAVLDLGSFDGGLTPVGEGGGMETHNLHLKSGHGRHWVFRSVDKDPKKALPPADRESLIGALAQDLTSTENPAGALITAPLLETAGVLHATPVFYLMPDDSRLGKFRGLFKGMLGALELREEKELPSVDKVLTTYELFERLEERIDERVDARDYLRARLIDIFVGDWDRGATQWRWVRPKNQEGVPQWRPVPRDRDMAFSRFEGIFPSLVEYYTIDKAGFGDGYPSIKKLTFSGQYIDRRFLVSLSKDAWDEVTAALVEKLSDAAIDDAVRHMPKEMYVKDGARILQALRTRRDNLPRASEDFYRLLAKDVDIRGTQGADDVEVLRNADGSVEVSIYPRDERAGQRLAPALFHRTMKSEETDEIRLYLLGGKDRVLVSGPGGKGILVRIIADGDSAQIVDQSRCSGCTDVRREAKTLPAAPTQKDVQARFEPVRDWGSDLFFYPQFGYDSSRGVVLGAKGTLTSFGFEFAPFANQTSLGAAYSTGTNQPRFDLATQFRTRSSLSILAYLSYSGMDQVNFFGFGNETPRDAALESSGFYRVHQQRFNFHPLLDVALFEPVHARVGGLFEHVSGVESTPIVAGGPGFGAKSLMAAEASLEINPSPPTSVEQRGFKLSLIGRYYPKLLSLDSDFGEVRASAAYFLNAHVLTDVLLSLHVAGEKNWGRYPWFEAAFLGGVPGVVGFDPSTVTGGLLRGYDLNRFSGGASAVGNVDLRIAIGKWNTILPTAYGVMGLADVGRVFYAPQPSSKWHVGGGGGLWLKMLLANANYQLTGTFNGVVVSSEEGTTFLLYSGIGF